MAGTNLSAGADAVAPTRARRQVGGDRRQEPLPPVSPPAPDRTIAVGRFAVFITMAAWVAFIATTIAQQFLSGAASSLRFKYEAVLYMVVVTLLTVSALSYLTARLGYYIRIRDHRRVPPVVRDPELGLRLASPSVPHRNLSALSASTTSNIHSAADHRLGGSS